MVIKLFDTTELMSVKKKYEDEVNKLRNIILEKFKDVDFLKRFDWTLCIVSGTIRTKIPDEWKEFMSLVKTESYPAPILGLEEPFEAIRISFDGREIYLRPPSHQRELQFGFARVLNADLEDAKHFFKMHVRNMKEDLLNPKVEQKTRIELKKSLSEYKESLKMLEDLSYS